MFRQATPADLNSILRLYGQLHPEDPVLDEALAQDRFLRIVESSDFTLFVWEVDSTVRATTYLNVVPNLTRSAAPYAIIENVVVDTGYRGQGIGRQIMAATIDAAWNAGCYKVELSTGSRKESTLGFYAACGMSGDAKTAFVAFRPAQA